jgi:Protein of unknown function DUF86
MSTATRVPSRATACWRSPCSTISTSLGRRGLPEEFRARHPEVDWKGWKDFRNLTTHAYWRADATIAAEAMECAIPVMVAAVAAELPAAAQAADIDSAAPEVPWSLSGVGEQPDTAALHSKTAGVGADMGPHRPADHAPAEGVEDDGQEQEPGQGRDVREVGEPELVGRLGLEVALDQVGHRLGLVCPHGGPQRSAPMAALDAGLPHQSRHPFARAADALLPQLGVDPTAGHLR